MLTRCLERKSAVPPPAAPLPLLSRGLRRLLQLLRSSRPLPFCSDAGQLLGNLHSIDL